MLTYTIGEKVFMVHMKMPGTVRKVISYDGSAYGYIVEVDDGYGTDAFRLDEVEDFHPELWY